MRIVFAAGVIGLLFANTLMTAESPKTPAALVAAQAKFEKSLENVKKASDESTKQAADEYKSELGVILEAETKAGRLDEALLVRDEIQRIEDGGLSKKVVTKADLQKALTGTSWDWQDAPLELKAGGVVGQRVWEGFQPAQATRWEAIDRRTVLLMITQGRDVNRMAVLHFTESLDSFTACNFDSKLIGPIQRLKPVKKKK